MRELSAGKRSSICSTSRRGRFRIVCGLRGANQERMRLAADWIELNMGETP
jgi:hypothetical protein